MEIQLETIDQDFFVPTRWCRRNAVNRGAPGRFCRDLVRLLLCLCLATSARAAATSVTFQGSGQGTLAPWGTAVFGFSGTSPRGVANKIATGSVSIVLQNGVNNGDTLELGWSVPDEGCCSVNLTLTVSGGTGIFASASGQITV